MVGPILIVTDGFAFFTLVMISVLKIQLINKSASVFELRLIASQSSARLDSEILGIDARVWLNSMVYCALLLTTV